jgi:predicted lipoprotein with Yx(FWY)xxD motif
MMVAAGAFCAMALALAACGGDDDDATPAATTVPTSAATTPTSGAAAATDATVQVADNPTLGKILVDADGRTLYLFEKYNGTTTACTGGCAGAWPALAAAQPTAGDGVDASKLATADAQVPDQVVYNGHLLYYFATDTAPGDIKGADIASWYALDANGDKVDKD